MVWTSPLSVNGPHIENGCALGGPMDPSGRINYWFVPGQNYKIGLLRKSGGMLLCAAQVESRDVRRRQRAA